MATAEVQQHPIEESKVLNRVMSYSFVNQLIEKSVVYYNTAKNTSPYVKNSCESVETTLAESVKWIVPKVQPIVHNQRVEPLLSTVDEFGVRQLERLEKLGETVHTSKILEHPVNSIVHAAQVCGQQIQESIVPVDNYLKDSTLFTPINKALDVAEVIAAKILPEEEKKQAISGPITRTARLSRRCQNEVIGKMKGLTLRSPESINAMAYCVDLIQYAQQNLDSGVKTCTEIFETSKTRVKKIQKDLAEAQKTQLKSAKNRIVKTSAEALHALQSVSTVLSQQIPNSEAVTAFPHASYETLKKKVKELQTRKDVAALTQWCQSSAIKLQEANATLAAYIASHEKIPQPLTKATSLVNSILESFVALTSNPTEAQDPPKVQTFANTTPETAQTDSTQSTVDEEEEEEENEEEEEEEEEEDNEDDQ